MAACRLSLRLRTLISCLRFAEPAEDFLNPWPKGEVLTNLSPARTRALHEAAGRLVDVAKHGSLSTAPRRPASRRPADDLAQVGPDLEKAVGTTFEELTCIFVLDGLKGFGPQKFKTLEERQITPEAAIRNPDSLPISGKTGDELKRLLAAVTPGDLEVARERAARQLVAARDLGATVLTYRHRLYPINVYNSNNAIPVLYVRGDLAALEQYLAVACVGSREIRPPYEGLQRAFAQHVVSRGGTVVSGFALGADTVAHSGAIDAEGRTLCVLPSGLDRPFPPENKQLYQDLLKVPGVAFISEFPIGTGASAMTLRKRNKLIVAAAGGVLVGQSSYKGGAMNAFRFAIEQHKPVATFASDGTASTTGNDQIATEARVATVAFPLDAGPETWDTWLSQLS